MFLQMGPSFIHVAIHNHPCLWQKKDELEDKKLFESCRKRMLLLADSVCSRRSCVEVYNVLDQRQHKSVYLSRLKSVNSSECVAAPECHTRLSFF